MAQLSSRRSVREVETRDLCMSSGAYSVSVSATSRLPPAAIIRPAAHETLATRIARYRVQIRFIFSRLRFHIVEELRYRAESYRWRQHLDRLS
jgi:hypothetical protein